VEPHGHTAPPPAAIRLGWTLALTATALFMITLDALVVMTALPHIGADLHVGLSSLQWTVNAYNIALAAGIISGAALGDRLGRRRTFVGGLVAFTAASALCALAPTAGLLVAARVLQGVGGAIVLPLSLTILAEAYPAERRAAILGVYGGIAGLAVAAGPLVGGALTEGLDWHWIFWLNVPIGVVAALASARLLPESRGPAVGLDLGGWPRPASPAWGSCGARPRPGRGLGEWGGARRAGARHARLRDLRRLGAVRRGAAAAAPPPARAGVPGRQRLRLPAQRLDRRGCLPHDPVVPARPGLVPVETGVRLLPSSRPRW